MNRQKILIVDDSELNREMLKAILGEEYDYAEAEDGAQALLMIQQDMHIDLLLLDINMPKIDGFGVLERMNQFRWIEELPVIMISAAEDRAVIERCYSLGITDYIRRPFDSFIVQRRVKNTLTLYANQKRLTPPRRCPQGAPAHRCDRPPPRHGRLRRFPAGPRP